MLGIIPPSSNAVVDSVSRGLVGAGAAAGVCAAAPMVDISTAIAASFFIVAPALLFCVAIEDVPNLAVLAVGNEDRAIRGLSHAVGARQRVVRTDERILAGEAGGKDLELARRLAIFEG